MSSPIKSSPPESNEDEIFTITGECCGNPSSKAKAKTSFSSFRKKTYTVNLKDFQKAMMKAAWSCGVTMAITKPE
ncbi:hypothetical protein Y032_1010g3384 [Ancylostoma ceylanicum]|uniref:Uncharacterized protein n=1 Tax=Ancylostoma ceylanicum TaxID=53326 RepID=A0A016W9G3_9BILA|nr:hypothetical protein Y032_1010g3384 [Ancylostoma ceylanicum]